MWKFSRIHRFAPLGRGPWISPASEFFLFVG